MPENIPSPTGDFDDDPDFRLHFNSLMRRLVKAGMVVYYSGDPSPTGNLEIHWNPDYKRMGGQAAFQGLAMLLADICPDQLLSEEEQALLLMLFQVLQTPPAND